MAQQQQNPRSFSQGSAGKGQGGEGGGGEATAILGADGVSGRSGPIRQGVGLVDTFA